VNTPENISDLCAAMAKAAAQIEGAIRGRVNPAFRSRYADLGAVVDAIKPSLVENGLWFTQRTQRCETGVVVETVILHASGQSLACGELFVPATKLDAQGFGSALTYCRRYSLMTAFGVPAEDEDGNAASAKPAAAKAAPVSDQETALILDSLREAALEGVEPLRKRLAAIPASEAKRQVWQTHGPALKAAADKVAG
jgi:hypothetical protein